MFSVCFCSVCSLSFGVIISFVIVLWLQPYNFSMDMNVIVLWLQTDIMDLLGSDLPVESDEGMKFAWSDGILLQVKTYYLKAFVFSSFAMYSEMLAFFLAGYKGGLLGVAR